MATVYVGATGANFIGTSSMGVPPGFQAGTDGQGHAAYTTDSDSTGSGGNDSVDATAGSSGGFDEIFTVGGDDTINMGATLNGADIIQAGDGTDTLILAGDYSQGVTMDGGRVSGFENFEFSQGDSFSYYLMLKGAVGAATFDFSGLTSSGAVVDASMVTSTSDPMTFEIGVAPFSATGAPSGSAYEFVAKPFVSDNIVGSAADTVVFGGTDSEQISLAGNQFHHVGSFQFDNGQYAVTVTNAQIDAGQTLHLQGDQSSFGHASLSIDASAVTDAGLDIIGGVLGDDTIKGGGGNDTIASAANVLGAYPDGNNYIQGDGGNDDITVSLHQSLTTRIDGGAGVDTVHLHLTAGDAAILDPSSIQSVEALDIDGYSADAFILGGNYSLTIDDGVMAQGQILPIAISDPAAGLTVDASAVKHGSFVFSLPEFGDPLSSPSGDSSSIIGGSGNDVFAARDPSLSGRNHYSLDGGGGVNTLDFSGDQSALNIDAAAGTATVSGSQPVTIANFDIYKFGSGNGSFNGSASADTICMLSPGEETAHGNAGNDVLYLGATLDSLDFIDGGANSDTVVLNGDYSAGLTLGSATLTSIERLTLQHLNGEPAYSYKLATPDGTVAAGTMLTVDASQLSSGSTLTFDGSAETDGHYSMIGGAGADTLTAGHLADTLNGGTGADSMAGGAGNDLFYVDNAGDKTIEAVGGGTDTVFASISYTLQAGQSIDDLATTSRAGTGAINLAGNELDQRIDGNYGNNVLHGGGSDIHGDTLYGFLGNDTFYVSNAADKVFEAVSDAGSDTVFTSVSYTLQSGQSIEYLATTSRLGTGTMTLTGNEQAQRIDGNYGVNGLYGGDGNDTLYGFDGNDRLGGGNGRDLMDGGNGNDIFTYSAVIQSTGVNRDLIQNFNFAQDKIDLPALPTLIDTKVTVGTLSDASFDTDLQTAIGAGQLPAHHAVLFTPSAGGDHVTGHMYLIVDVNGTAGYQAGADYVIELQNATGTLNVDDFT